MNTWLKFGSGLATGALLWMVFPEAMLGKVGRFDPPDLQIDESPLEEPIKAATSFAPVVKSASPCVVSIQTVQERSSAAGSMDLDAFRRFFDPEGRFPMPEERDLPAQGTGSGGIVSSDGFILTNFHVVEGTQSISVVLADGTTSLDAEIVGADKHSDLAVLKVQRKGLSAITLGNSDHLEVGDVVLALGSPFGLSQSVTMGIVSATGRAQIGMMDIENFIQTDASINPGNSGGALIDAQGRLIGINTMIMSRSGGNQGIGFAIPVNMARSVMDQMVEYGDVQRGLLGISMQELTESMAKGFGLDSTEGVLVGDVTPEGPAEAGGVIPGDVVVTYDEKPISDMNALKLMVVETRPGSAVALGVIRNGASQVLNVTIGALPEEGYAGLLGGLGRMRPPLEDKRQSWIEGLDVAPMSSSLRQRYGIPESVDGLLITRIEPSSFAHDQGLREGQVILEINQQPVAQLSDLDEVGALTSGQSSLLRIWSSGSARFMVVERP